MDKPLLDKFVKLSVNTINQYKGVKLSKIPKVILTNDKNKTATLGHFDPNVYEIVCYTKNRLDLDIFRTIAHELVHAAQLQVNEITDKSGETGSVQENEANSIAGIIMRKWNTLSKHINDTPLVKEVDNVIQNITSSAIKKDNSNKYDYGCLMLKLIINTWSSFINNIPEHELYIDPIDNSKGREHEPHITVLYGLKDEVLPILELEKLIKRTFTKPIDVYITGVTYFDNDKFDVLKMDVQSEELSSFHDLIKANYPNDEKYDEYKPHITIAYLKKGFGKKYIKVFKETKRISSDLMMYSKPSGFKEYISLSPEYSSNDVIKTIIGYLINFK